MISIFNLTVTRGVLKLATADRLGVNRQDLTVTRGVLKPKPVSDVAHRPWDLTVTRGVLKLTTQKSLAWVISI